MGRKISDEKWELMVCSHREDPGNINRAKDLAKVTWEAANRAWHVGNPKQGRPPIHEVLAIEQLKARAEMAAKEAAKRAASEKEAEDARREAVEARAQEGKLVKLARGSAIQLLASTSQLAQAALKLSAAVVPRLQVEVETIAKWTEYHKDTLAGGVAGIPTPDRAGMDVRDVLSCLERIVRLGSSSTGTARECMEMERLLLGAPTQVIGIVSDGPGMEADLDMASARMRIEQAQAALRRAEGFRPYVIEGGAGEEMVEEEEDLGQTDFEGGASAG